MAIQCLCPSHLEASFEEIENNLLHLEDLCGQCEFERCKHTQSQQLENYKKSKSCKEMELPFNTISRNTSHLPMELYSVYQHAKGSEIFYTENGSEETNSIVRNEDGSKTKREHPEHLLQRTHTEEQSLASVVLQNKWHCNCLKGIEAIATGESVLLSDRVLIPKPALFGMLFYILGSSASHKVILIKPLHPVQVSPAEPVAIYTALPGIPKSTMPKIVFHSKI
ncbi:hypothetical protein P7K49_007307 [Saguinus oedipus]|uniref:Uncharacterized protein n=1 Tax=Saguinus oedipus TaxID=9490 RepID=A0ABQ9VUG7_SAGOE|nr:hypothetical protein P7K49_007307 [Saguinus oedipus]